MAQINKPDEYFNTKLYTGDGTNPRAITGVGFQPDLVWNKPRSSANSHALLDSVRGATKFLSSDISDAEYTYSHSLQSFDSDGFTCGDNLSFNQNTVTYASWNWLAGGTASSNTDGSITSNVSANTTSGFSIVSYTGTGANATVGHGLGVAPSMIINKCRSASQNWATYHSSLGGTKALFLDGTDAQTTSSSYFNNTDPTSSVFSVGNSGDTNKSSQTHISYCFAEKKGFSKFGSYTGNGNADGTFVYTGFKPAFVLAKKTNEQFTSWIMLDNKRANSFNAIGVRIFANLSNAENTSSNYCDFLSNGFKYRTTDNNGNDSNDTYIYMAFAEQPLVGTNNIPAVAR